MKMVVVLAQSNLTLAVMILRSIEDPIRALREDLVVWVTLGEGSVVEKVLI
jgi:hypothetical protein